MKEQKPEGDRKESHRIYFDIWRQIKSFLKRPRMFAHGVEATYATFMTYIACLDAVLNNEETRPASTEEWISLTKRHRAFMVEQYSYKDLGCAVYPSGITQEELVQHFRDFCDTHIAIQVPGAALTPEEISAFLGLMPVRQEIEVLGRDDAKGLKLGWAVDERMGLGLSNKK
jgi:hypothetical protein